jgi:hypothetical protein
MEPLPPNPEGENLPPRGNPGHKADGDHAVVVITSDNAPAIQAKLVKLAVGALRPEDVGPEYFVSALGGLGLYVDQHTFDQLP